MKQQQQQQQREAQQAQQAQQQQISSPNRTLGSSASTPGLRVAPLHTGSSSSSSPAKQKQMMRPASSAAFSASPSSSPLPVTHALSILPPMSPPNIVRPAAAATVAFSAGRREESKDHSGDDGEEDEADGSSSDFAADMSSLSLASGSDLNLAEGIDLLESNLLRLLPNALVRSGKYKLQVTNLLKALRQRANQAHSESKARKAALESALLARSIAESSESRYRTAISNLQLDSWGDTEQLQKDIRALEAEIIKRGRTTVEDHQSVGVGLQFGIESDTAPTSSVSAAPGSSAGTAAASSSISLLSPLKTRGETVAMVTETVSLRESTSKLVFTKYKRLEQLIYLLRRKLATLENYPSQRLIESKFGSLENLIASQAALETEVERLESRLASQRIQFKSDALLRTRNLNTLPPAFLHLLIVSLQASLASYTAAWENVMGFAKEAASGLGAKHPLYSAFRQWNAEVERESKKMDVTHSAASNKKLTDKRTAGATATAAAGPVGVLHLNSVHDKIDIDQLWASLSASAATKEGAMSKRGAASNSSSSHHAQEHKESTTIARTLRPAVGSHSSSASASTSSSSSSSDLSASNAALADASSKIAALEFELGLLRKENKTLSWMQGILAREGIISNRSGTDLSPALKESRERAMDEGETQQQPEADAEEEENEAQIEIISSTHTLPSGGGHGNDDEDDEEEATDRVLTPERRHKPLSIVSASTPVAAGASADATAEDEAPDSPPPTMLRAITITAPRARDLVSPKGVAQGNNGMGSLARQASLAASPSGAGRSGTGVSTVSKSLLTHLQHYVTELREYKRQVLAFQHLHSAREQSLARSEADRWTLQKCMMMLLKKYPQISEGGAIGSSNCGGNNGSARGAHGASSSHAAGGSSSRLAPGQSGSASHLGISRQGSSASLGSSSSSGSIRSKGNSPTR